MGTRGFIARPKGEDGFEGRYHHWDSYPQGLGATLFEVRLKIFNGDTDAMLKFLLDEHEAGWSSINSANWEEEPGYGTSGPQCYCHGTRSEDPFLLTEKEAADVGCEYGYVIDGSTMKILGSFNVETKDGVQTSTKMIGFFGSGNPDAEWAVMNTIDLDGEEPNWEEVLS